MSISSRRIEAIFDDCLFAEDADRSNAVMVEGIMFNVGFDPIKLAGNREEVLGYLRQLDDTFKTNGGGGGLFLTCATTATAINGRAIN